MLDAPPRYAIFRTRLQPYTQAHSWAIKNFLHWADRQKTEGATDLILAIVDPSLRMNDHVRKHRPRFIDELNPFSDWMSAQMGHKIRCKPSDPHCNRVIITRIPSLALLTDRRAKKGAIKELRERLPMSESDNSIWYFPIFDQEDLVDIEKLWICMKQEDIPKIPILVSHHHQFEYCLEEGFGNSDNSQKIGVYAAAAFEMLEHPLNRSFGYHPIIPDEITRLIKSNYINNIRDKLEKCSEVVEHEPAHPLRTSVLFSYVNPLTVVDTLVRSHKRIFGDDIRNDLSYLPPEKESSSLLQVLQKEVIAPIQDFLGQVEFQKSFGGIVSEVECPIFLTKQNSKVIFDEIVKVVNESYPMHKDINRIVDKWKKK